MADSMLAVSTPETNAHNYIEKVNKLLLDNEIKDRSGAIAYIKELPSNPAYLFALALGQMMTERQELVRDAYSCLDPSSCNDDRLLVLAQLSGLTRKAGTTGHLAIKLHNTKERIVDMAQSDDTHTVYDDTQNRITVRSNNAFKDTINNKLWYIDQDISIRADDTVVVYAYCESQGAFNVNAGIPISPVTAVDGLESVTAQDAVPGNGLESVSSLRARLLMNTREDAISRCLTAVRQLPGIQYANLWFNELSNSPLALTDGSALPARTAALSIRGTDIEDSIGKTVYTWMNAPFFNWKNSNGSPSSVHVGTVRTSSYTRGSTIIVVPYAVAKECPMDISVYIRQSTVKAGALTLAKDKLLAYSGTLAPGTSPSTSDTLKWLAGFDRGEIIGTFISRHDAPTAGGQGYEAVLYPTEYATWSGDNIHVMEA